MTEVSKYFSGEYLIGDDYSPEQLQKWYDDEKEGYAEIADSDMFNGEYLYDNLNVIHGFDKLPDAVTFENVLGFGSAYGYEFKPIAERIKNLTIVEPSDQLNSREVFGIKPKYSKPHLDGKLDLPDNSFDLITCFGVLHHIANVSYVLQELIRVLKPGGYLMVREPIVSMGDWRKPRPGLTQHERGIPEKYFEKAFSDHPDLEVVSKRYLFCMTNFLENTIGRLFSKPLKTYQLYINFDAILAKLLQWNISYHHDKFLKKIAPQNVFYIVKKSF